MSAYELSHEEMEILRIREKLEGYFVMKNGFKVSKSLTGLPRLIEEGEKYARQIPELEGYRSQLILELESSQLIRKLVELEDIKILNTLAGLGIDKDDSDDVNYRALAIVLYNKIPEDRRNKILQMKPPEKTRYTSQEIVEERRQSIRINGK
ncbi:hypothetical protein HYX15_03730 [Candidatus Woesearchaeota archaeon]|nr:hypothetical protein [Candidatus Woesearchaeota archaeon]